MPEPKPELTELLGRMSAGDRNAEAELYRQLHEDLQRRARSLLGGANAMHSLRTAGLVSEAYMRIAKLDGIAWESRQHFLAVACKAMRSVLVDHARRKAAKKRQADEGNDALDQIAASYEERALNIIDLDLALETFAALDPQAARIVELRFFAGLTVPEVAAILGIGTATVVRDWNYARSWLYRHLS